MLSKVSNIQNKVYIICVFILLYFLLGSTYPFVHTIIFTPDNLFKPLLLISYSVLLFICIRKNHLIGINMLLKQMELVYLKTRDSKESLFSLYK